MRSIVLLATTAVLATACALAAPAQPPQLPTLQVPNPTNASGDGVVGITSRKDGTHAGTIRFKFKLTYAPPGDEYPAGSVTLDVDLSDALKMKVASTTVDELTSTGTRTPTVVVSGRCKVDPGDRIEVNPRGCRYWMLATDNSGPNEKDKGTPDVVSILIVDQTGKRLAEATGPLVAGDLTVDPTPN